MSMTGLTWAVNAANGLPAPAGGHLRHAFVTAVFEAAFPSGACGGAASRAACGL
jgi:hypothetical protein